MVVWLLAHLIVAVGFVAHITVAAPTGYQNEDGFHYGVNPDEDTND